MKKILDSFEIVSRFFPAILSILPLLVLYYFLLDIENISVLISFIFSIKFIGGAGLSIIFIILLSQLIRSISKRLQVKYFTEKQGFPTAYYMSYEDDTYSDHYKDRYRELIKKNFQIELLNKDEEIENKNEAVKRLNEVTALVINKCRSKGLVRNHILWYAFLRNLIGGSIFAIFLCIFNIIINYLFIRQNLLYLSSVILLIVYIVLFFMRRLLLFQSASDLAKQVLSEFLKDENQAPA